MPASFFTLKEQKGCDLKREQPPVEQSIPISPQPASAQAELAYPPQPPVNQGGRQDQSSREQRGNFQFTPGTQSHIYLKVYFAIPDYNDFKQTTRWFYSHSDSTTSKQEVVIQ